MITLTRARDRADILRYSHMGEMDAGPMAAPTVSSLLAYVPNMDYPDNDFVAFRPAPEYVVSTFERTVAKFPAAGVFAEEEVKMKVFQVLELAEFINFDNQVSTVMYVCGLESKIVISVSVDFSAARMVADYINVLNQSMRKMMPGTDGADGNITNIVPVSFTVEADGHIYMHNTGDESIVLINAKGGVVKHLQMGMMSIVTLGDFLQAPTDEFGCPLMKRPRGQHAQHAQHAQPAIAGGTLTSSSNYFLVVETLHLFTAVAHLYRKKDAGKYEIATDVYLQPGLYTSLEDFAAGIRSGINMKGERNGGIFDVGVSVKRTVLRIMAHHRQPKPSYLELHPGAGGALIGLSQTRRMPLGNKKFIDLAHPPKRVCAL